MTVCVVKSLNKVFLMGGAKLDNKSADDVYSWDLRDDQVTRRNHMAKTIIGMSIVV
jgi:hypothetical protein